MKTDIAYIYALLDPRDNSVRYIGKTINPKDRLRQHLYCKKEHNYRSIWINSLIKKNLKPLMKILKICPLTEFVKYETEFIRLYKDSKLTNSDETGQGNINRKREIIDRAIKKISKIVYQYDLNGDFIQKFKSVRFAAEVLELSHSNISRSCNGIFSHTGGFIFRFKKVAVKKIDNPNAVRKCVVEIDEFGNIIEKWDSIMDCSRSTKIDNSNISRVCNEKMKSIKGRYFKFY